jgi:hypothetical protein
MKPTPTPGADHPRFDAICARLEDFEPLPTVTAAPSAPGTTPESTTDEAEHAAPLNELILAGLVSP